MSLPAEGHTALPSAIGVLALFQALAIVLNLIPVPPLLTGSAAILPWLPRELAQLAMTLSMYAFLLFFAVLFFVPQVWVYLLGASQRILGSLGIDPYYVQTGWNNLFFWRQPQ